MKPEPAFSKEYRSTNSTETSESEDRRPFDFADAIEQEYSLEKPRRKIIRARIVKDDA